MFDLMEENFYQNIERMEEETKKRKKQTEQMQQTNKEIDKISTKIKNTTDSKKMLELIQQQMNMITAEMKEIVG